MPSHRAHRRSDRSSRDCCYKPLPSLLRTATLRARNSKTKSGELCLASFSCAYVNEELSYSRPRNFAQMPRSEEHTSELQSLTNLVCRLLLEKKKQDK